MNKTKVTGLALIILSSLPYLTQGAISDSHNHTYSEKTNEKINKSLHIYNQVGYGFFALGLYLYGKR